MLPTITLFGQVSSSLYPMQISISGGLEFSRLGKAEKLWQSIKRILPNNPAIFLETSEWKSEYKANASIPPLYERKTLPYPSLHGTQRE